MFLKIIWLLLSFAIGVRAGMKLDEDFKELKWYDKMVVIYWGICVTGCMVVTLIAIWNWK